ncbi:MAG TPA: hypothetical protein VGP94_09465, partial [Tepidisphaeraceae bacterium]|nr:hypothetical protein [Tepidisphaeraceae bacterium]
MIHEALRRRSAALSLFLQKHAVDFSIQGLFPEVMDLFLQIVNAPFDGLVQVGSAYGLSVNQRQNTGRFRRSGFWQDMHLALLAELLSQGLYRLNPMLILEVNGDIAAVFGIGRIPGDFGAVLLDPLLYFGRSGRLKLG